jgi:hypothetical protein
MLRMLSTQNDALQSAVERVLQSRELHGSQVSQKLLKFLAERSLSGDADQLKEYTIAIDGLGKPDSYDPRHNSAVRIQVGRLRQKLGEYYRTEGKEDDVVIDLPKGCFQLTCTSRRGFPAAALESSPSEYVLPPQAEEMDGGISWWGPAVFMIVAAMVALLSMTYLVVRLSSVSTFNSGNWNEDFEKLWRPFVGSALPSIVAIEDPLFVQMASNPGIYYRDRSLNQWEDVPKSAGVTALRSTYGSNSLQPSHYYTAYGEAQAAFLLGKFLGPRMRNFSVLKTSQLSWQQLADNNVLFVGVQNLFFDKQLMQMPLTLPLTPFLNGVHNLHPKSGEPADFLDNYTTAPSETGTAYALVTCVPGPRGRTYIESFTSNRSAGYLGALEWFSDPAQARILVDKLEGPSGKMPNYFQVLLSVQFVDDVPTRTNYILSRVLH